MAMIGSNSKANFWSEIINKPSGVTPGQYINPVLIINENGIITDASASSITSNFVVDERSDLDDVINPQEGTTVLVRDNGNGVAAFYVYDGATWVIITSTSGNNNIKYQQSTLNTNAIQNIGDPINTQSIVKKYTVHISSAYNNNATMIINTSNRSGTIPSFPNHVVNASVIGTYVFEIPENNIAIGSDNQLTVRVMGGPTSGAGLAIVEYFLP